MSSSHPSPKIVMLWCVPRSASTAFEKAFQQRTDTTVVHEPFTDSYYFGRTRRSFRYGDADYSSQCDEQAAERIIFGSTTPLIFVKELAFQGLHYVSDTVLSRAKHTFLIRSPHAVYESLQILKPDFTEEEFGFQPLLALHERISRDLQMPTWTIESHAFRAEPRRVFSEYCNWLGIDFDPHMLTWNPGPIRPWQSHEAESQAKWHKTLEASNSVLPAELHNTSIQPEHHDIVERAEQIYRSFLDNLRTDVSMAALDLGVGQDVLRT
jgi:hypothetical protein